MCRKDSFQKLLCIVSQYTLALEFTLNVYLLCVKSCFFICFKNTGLCSCCIEIRILLANVVTSWHIVNPANHLRVWQLAWIHQDFLAHRNNERIPEIINPHNRRIVYWRKYLEVSSSYNLELEFLG